MDNVLLLAAAGVGGFLAGVILTIVGASLAGRSLTSRAKRDAAKVVTDAEREAATIEKEAQTALKEQRIEMRAQIEKEAREQRKELVALEKRILAKEETVDKRLEAAEQKVNEAQKKERQVAEREHTLDAERDRLNQVIAQQTEKLEAIAGFTADEAKRELFHQLEAEVKRDTAVRLKRVEDELVENADKKAKWIISNAIQRCAADTVAEAVVSVVALPNDEMKGRIIGREGRNIRALEAATGINVIIDDTPEAVILSGFDPIRRETARITLERLIQDGRIHPARIEEVAEKVAGEMEKTVKELGEAACMEVDVYGLHPELIRLIGRLHYRTSYGQNVLRHTVETTFLAAMMAAELGLDIHEAKRGALLHDIGKTMTHEMEGSHALIGAEACKRHGEKEVVVNAVAAHHNEVEMTSPISVIVQAADALSAARPGARRETLDNYIKRLEQLETIADGFPGVEKSYALQAGRDLRVVAVPERVSDAEACQLARDIARKIESEVTYPGQIKVTVVRETRAVDTAT